MSDGFRTIDEVARRAGVSITTVSRVLSASTHPVSEQTRRRVLEAARLCDYHPSAAARALSSRRSRCLGIAVPDLANPYYAEIVRPVQEEASARGYTVIHNDFQRDPDRLHGGLRLFCSHRTDGVLVAGGGSSQVLDLRPLERARIPVVVIGRHRSSAPSIRVDNVAAGGLAAEHLIERGHREVAFLTGPPELTTVQDRLQGFRDACARAGATLRVQPGDFKPLSGFEGTRRALREWPGVTAICAANDHMAVGAMAACWDAGVPIPAGVALVGFDDVPMAAYLRPALTTIAIPTHQLGVRSAGLLFSLIQGHAVPETTWIEVRLVARASSAAGGST
jgi:DNA-binding LacI/PurR family transcriptional regulator